MLQHHYLPDLNLVRLAVVLLVDLVLVVVVAAVDFNIKGV
jgi:hypothetical protein